MSTVKLVAVFSENKPGQLERVTQLLAGSGINIQWVTIATSETFGVIKLLVDRCDAAFNLLKENGFTVSLIEVLAVEVQDQPGGLHTVAEALLRHHINMQNASGFVSNNRAVLLIEVKDLEQAKAAAVTAKLHLLSPEETLRL
jgi:hypothetical protein